MSWFTTTQEANTVVYEFNESIWRTKTQTARIYLYGPVRGHCSLKDKRAWKSNTFLSSEAMCFPSIYSPPNREYVCWKSEMVELSRPGSRTLLALAA